MRAKIHKKTGLKFVPTQLFSSVHKLSRNAKKTSAKRWRICQRKPYNSVPTGLSLIPVLVDATAPLVNRYKWVLGIEKGYILKQNTILGILNGEKYTEQEAIVKLEEDEGQAIYVIQHLKPGKREFTDECDFILDNKNRFLDRLGHCDHGSADCNVSCSSGSWINGGHESERIMLFRSTKLVKEGQTLCYDYNPFWITMPEKGKTKLFTNPSLVFVVLLFLISALTLTGTRPGCNNICLSNPPKNEENYTSLSHKFYQI